MCKHKIGELGEPCLVCGSRTVYFNEKHSMCKVINCPLWYTPQQWFEKVVLEDGKIVVRLKEELQNGQD